MLHRIFKQRRRFAFALLLTQLALYNVWTQSFIFAVMGVIMLVGVMFVATSGNPLRRLVECCAIGILAARFAPDATTATLIFLVATGLAYTVFYSRLLDYTPFRFGMRSRKLFLAPFDLRTTWAKVLPGQGHPAAFWTGTVVAFQRDEHDPSTIYISLRPEGEPIEDITVTYLHLIPGKEATYLLERDTLLPGEEILITYHFTEAGPGETRIQSDMRVSGLPFRHAVERFFDDVLGDELDSFATMTHCKRSWHIRDAGDVALTSALGRDMVTLDVVTDNAPTGQAQSDAVGQRQSA